MWISNAKKTFTTTASNQEAECENRKPKNQKTKLLGKKKSYCRIDLRDGKKGIKKEVISGKTTCNEKKKKRKII